MRLGGILDLSTIDFPGKLCSVIFLTGCPFRCPYCHNHELIKNNGNRVSPKRIAQEISENYLIDGVCITGGEPTMQNDLRKLIKELKDYGLAVKLDTNGYYPDKLKKVLKYVDYVALDFKTSPNKYATLSSKNDAWGKVSTSIKLLNRSDLNYELRTTVVPGLVWEDELREIAYFINENQIKTTYYLQRFSNENPLDETLKKIEPPKIEDLEKFKKFFNIEVKIR